MNLVLLILFIEHTLRYYSAYKQCENIHEAFSICFMVGLLSLMYVSHSKPFLVLVASTSSAH